MRLRKLDNLVRIVLSALLSLPSPAWPSQSDEVDARTATLYVPPMLEGFHCKAHVACYKTSLPAEAEGQQIKIRPVGYRSTQTRSYTDDKRVIISETLTRGERANRPATWFEILGRPYLHGRGLDDEEPVSASVLSAPLDEPAEKGTPTVALSYSFDNPSAFQQFMTNYGAPILTGMASGYAHYLWERENQARQAAAAYEIERSFRQNRAVNGNYVRAVNVELAALSARRASDSVATWLSAGANILRLTSAPRDFVSARERAEYEKMLFDPATVRIYTLNETAQTQITDDVRQALGKRNYLKAATELESLQFEASGEKLPEDLTKLQNPDGILRFEVADPSIPPSPLANARFKTPKASELGQVVRRLANRYQAVWAETRGLSNWSDDQVSIYVSGLSLLRSADESLAAGNPGGHPLLRLSNAFLDFTLGLTQGAVKGVEELIKLVPEMYKLGGEIVEAMRDPGQLADLAVQVAASAPQIIDAIWQEAIKSADRLVNGTARERGEILGRAAFEAILAFGTGGTVNAAKSAGQAAKGLVALKKVTETVKSSAIGRLARSTLVREIGDAIDSVPKPLVKDLLKTAAKDPEKFYDATGIYRRARETLGHAVASDITRVALRTENPGAREFLKMATASIKDEKNKALYLKNGKDAQRIVNQYQRIDSAIRKEKPIKVEGYVTRLADRAFVSPKEPEKAFAKGEWSRVAKGRYGMGGPEGQFVQSAGFGIMEEAARDVARAEIKSYGYDISNMVEHTRQISYDGVLDLRKPQPLGLTPKAITILRDYDHSYETTNIIGHSAKRNGFKAVLAPSAALDGGVVIHFLE